MLESIIASKTKVRLLRRMFAHPKVEYCLDELVRSTGLSTGTLFPAISDMISARILQFRIAGRSKLYKVNERHSLYDGLVFLFGQEASKPAQIAKRFASEIDKSGLRSIVLFGSAARGEFDAGSDIDLLFLYSGSESAVRQKVGRLSSAYLDVFDVEVAPVLVSRKDLTKKGQMRRFLLSVSGDGRVIWGDKKWLEKLRSGSKQ